MLNKTIATTYRSYLNSSALLSKAVAPMLNKEGKLSAQHVKDFAQEHAHFYECAYIVRDSGSVAFFRNEDDTTSANIHDAAKKAWQRGIGKFVATSSKRGGARNKAEVDPLKKARAAMMELNLSQRRKLVAEFKL